MRILFVGLRSQQESPGVLKKLHSQIAAFEALGHQVWATDLDADGCWLLHQGRRTRLLDYAAWPPQLAPNRNSNRLLLAAADVFNEPFDFCYIRKTLCDAGHLKALAALHRRGTLVVEEVPTYPYDAELEQQGSLASRLYLAIDRHYRRQLPAYVQGIATFSFEDAIFGVPAIQIGNGIDVDGVPLHQKRPGDGMLKIITVSSMLLNHGYDRLLQGLAAYRQGGGTRPIELHMVGDGPMRAPWQALSHSLGLQSCVTFHGVQTGPALDTLFAGCDIAASSFGWHRKGINTTFELKAREYIARGLPFFYSAYDPAATAAEPYTLKVPEDESPLDMQAVLDFYDGIKADDYPDILRRYAREHLGWQQQLQKVLDFAAAFKKQA